MLMRAYNGDGYPRAVHDGVVCTRDWERRKATSRPYQGKVPRDFVPSAPYMVGKDGTLVRVRVTEAK